MELIKITPIELPVVIAGVYGLRREEVIGIKWNAIDFKTKTLTIRHTVGRGKIDGVTQFIFKDRAKSDSGYRTLPLFDFIANLLNYYKENYKLVDTNSDIEKRYNEENNVPKEFEKLLKDLIFNDENEKI